MNLLFLFMFFVTHLFSTEEVKLLDDQEEMKEYLAAFPYDSYEVCHIPEQGDFYVDKIYINHQTTFSLERDDWIKYHLGRGYVWEPYIRSLLEKYIRPGSTVIDIGAHIGTHSISMAKFTGPEGRVISFEPQRKMFRELYWNIILNQLENITIYRYAIGHKHCVLQMDLSEKGNEGGTKIGSGGDLVELRTLDSFHLSDVSLIKMDVEEFENYALEGAKKTILNNKPVIIIEIMGKYTVVEELPQWVKSRIKRTKRKLKEMGYDVSHIIGADYLAIPINP